MWIFLWIVISAFVIGIFVWNFKILMQRKSAWKSFAKKHKLEYTPNALMQSPLITGRLADFRIYLYEDIQQTDDITGQRFVTAIDIDMGEGFPTGGALATKEYKAFLEALNFKDTYMPNDTFHDKGYLVRARDRKKLNAFMTEERLDMVDKMFSMKNSSAIYFFDELEAIIHIETTDPLVDPEKLELIFKKLIAIAKVLYPKENEKSNLTPEEKQRLIEASEKATKRQSPQQSAAVIAATDEPVHLELEDDEEAEEKSTAKASEKDDAPKADKDKKDS